MVEYSGEQIRQICSYQIINLMDFTKMPVLQHYIYIRSLCEGQIALIQKEKETENVQS